MEASAGKNPLSNPLVQLTLAVISVTAAASLEYSWTLFVRPIDARHHWGVPAIQVAYSAFVLLQTGLAPLVGYLVDRIGPAPLVLGAGTMVALSWFINSTADSLPMLYFGNALAGISAGCIRVACTGQALKWFTGRRGLAAGVVAAGYGAGTAITAGPIARLIQSDGYEHAFLVFGLIQGAIIMLVSLGMRAPQATLPTPRPAAQTRPDYTPAQVLRNPLFYLMYLLFALVAFGGLAIAPSVSLIAQDLHVTERLQIPGIEVATLTVALALNRTFDGAGRITFSWMSDRIGREVTMALTFLIGGCTLLMLENNGSDPIGFIVITTIYLASYGQIFALFPATAADTFGPRFAAANYGMLYTAKALAGLLVPVFAAVASTHGWGPVCVFAMCCNVLAAVGAIMVLAPLRDRQLDQAAKSRGVPAHRRSRAS